ncbi:MAG: hypothetical protein IJ814_00660 [Paludibacteraceae bacterium]|nr:hypothetical protein [Paludibacteraceae bacterium]
MTKNYSKIFLLAATLLVSMNVLAQNMTSSPFSRYAYGDLNENVPNAYRAMGGVGFGMRNNRAICAAQPASYTACDSLTFMMDIAANVNWSRYQDATGMRNKANGNLEYLMLQFPLWKRWIAMSVGLLPFSSVGYDINERDSTTDLRGVYDKKYYGTGNISQVYGGLSFNICNWVALGLNVYYMWGDLDRMRTLTFVDANKNPTIQDESMTISTVRLRYGAQFFHTWGKHTINAGGVFENKRSLNSEYIVIETQTEDSIPIYKGGFEAPMMFGVGAAYVWDNRLTIAFDFEREFMANAQYNGGLGSMYNLRDRNRYAIGVEYRHNPMGRNYAERMIWRAGLNVQDEYLTTIEARRITASVGVGFPLYTIGTVINMTLEYGHRGTLANGGLEDNSLRFTIGASIVENWFFKRKL